MHSPDSEKHWKDLSRSEKQSVIFGAGIVFLVLAGVIYSSGRPWNCSDAQSMLKEVERKQGELVLLALKEGNDSAAIGGALFYQDAQKKVAEKCPAK
jgi:hypothetical protein